MTDWEKLQISNLLKQELRDLAASMASDDRKKHLWNFVLNPEVADSESKLARRLGISRQAVNVAVDTLRQKLDEIEAKLEGVQPLF